MALKRSRLIYTLFWIAFANGIVATFISIYGLKSSSLPDTVLAWVYLVLQQVGHFQFLAWLTALPLAVLAILLPFRALIRLLAYALFVAFLLLIYADYVVYQLYRFHFNSMVWNLLVGGAADEILVFEWASVLSMLAVLAIALVIQWMIFSMLSIYQNRSVQSRGKWVFLTVLTIQISGQAIHVWADAWQKSEILTQVRHIPLAQPVKMKRFLRKRGWLPDVPVQARLVQKGGGDFLYPLKPMQCSVSDNKLNLMIVISDGLRSDMLNPSVMPFWSKFASQAQQFDNHFSSGNATRFGVFGLFSGLHGQYWFDAVGTNTTSVLISELKRQRYRFGFFANAKLSSPEFDRAIFHAVKEQIPAKTPGKTVIERELYITEQAKEFIQQESSSPFFTLIFFDAPHAYVHEAKDAKFKPALDSLNYLELDNDSDPIPFKNRYQNSISFNDRLTADILQSLEASGKLENTIVVMTGDHGQEMNETRSNSWGHNSNFSRYQIQVPMIVHWPGKAPASYNHMSSHVDLVPTLMKDWLNCQNEIADFSNGRSLFDQSARDYILSKNWNNHAVIDPQFTYVFTPYGTDVFHSDSWQRSEIAPGLDTARQLKVLESLSHFYPN